MKVSQNTPNAMTNTNATSMRTNFTQKISQEEAKELKSQIQESAKNFVLESLKAQNTTLRQAPKEGDFMADYEEFQSFLKEIGYNGKSIAQLSKEEASKLVSEDGIFGIKQTSERIAAFVINGANGDEAKMRLGREGMLSGFKMAQELWGSKLPEISQVTMQNSVEMVDKAMSDLGFSLMDTQA